MTNTSKLEQDLQNALAQLAEAQAQLAEQEHLVAAGNFALKSTHKFSNLMTAILGRAELMLHTHGLSPAMERDLRRIIQAVEEADALIKQISAFKNHLPAAGQPTLNATEKSPTHDLPGSGAAVLFVEDDLSVIGIIPVMLEEMGFEAILATSGEQAIAVYQERQDDIVLVISDLILPGMNGKRLFQTLKTQNPAVKMILITGYSLIGEEQRLHEEGYAGWLQKPITFRQLSRAIGTALLK